MELEQLTYFILFFILIGLSAFFSGSEVAFFSLSSSEREKLAHKKSYVAKKILQLINYPSRLLATILILNTVVNVSAVVIAAFLTLQLADILGYNQVILILVEIVVVTLIILIVGEITPKLIAKRFALNFTTIVVIPMSVFMWLLSPVTKLFEYLRTIIQKKFQADKKRNTIKTTDIEQLADVVSTRTNIDEPSKNLFQIISGLSDISVKDILIPRMNITAFDIKTSYEKLIDAVKYSQHSYIPIYENNMDNILGIIRSKELLVYLTIEKSSKEFKITNYLQKPLFVPETKKVIEMIKQFQDTRIHCAIVVDEHGGTVGMITLNSTLKYLMDDYKTILQSDLKRIKKMTATTFLVSGSVPVETIEIELNTSLDIGETDISTIGGFVFHLAGKVPDKGEKFTYKNLIFEPISIKQNRIDELIITLTNAVI